LWRKSRIDTRLLGCNQSILRILPEGGGSIERGDRFSGTQKARKIVGKKVTDKLSGGYY